MDSSKENDIKKLIQFIDPHGQNVEWLKTLFSNVTPLKENERGQFLKEMDFDIVVALYYPIYNKYFTHDEIEELINFFSSDVGIKLVQSKSNSVSVLFMPNELKEIEQFKKTKTGKKYNSLSDKITHQYVESVKQYIDSLKSEKRRREEKGTVHQ